MKRNKYWFESKKFGWGYVPISWEGWLMVLAFLSLMMTSAYLHNLFSENVTTRESLSFIFDLALLILLSIPLYQMKCKDKPRWRWGK